MCHIIPPSPPNKKHKHFIRHQCALQPNSHSSPRSIMLNFPIIIILCFILIYNFIVRGLRSHVVLQQRGSQQRHVLRQPKLPGVVERRGRMLAARQEDIQRHKPDTVGFRELQSGERINDSFVVIILSFSSKTIITYLLLNSIMF